MTECDKPNAPGLWAMKEAGKEPVFIQVVQRLAGLSWLVFRSAEPPKHEFPTARYIRVDWPYVPKFSEFGGWENIKVGDWIQLKLKDTAVWGDAIYRVTRFYFDDNGLPRVNFWASNFCREHDVRRVKPPEPLT